MPLLRITCNNKSSIKLEFSTLLSFKPKVVIEISICFMGQYSNTTSILLKYEGMLSQKKFISPLKFGLSWNCSRSSLYCNWINPYTSLNPSNIIHLDWVPLLLTFDDFYSVNHNCFIFRTYSVLIYSLLRRNYPSFISLAGVNESSNGCAIWKYIYTKIDR